jgi:serine-type D-Ala-D-Ala carboxypeptidase (penicillin-binding protein 5/6)
LLNYGFRFFETHKLYAGNEALTQARIWKGASTALPLGLGDDLYVTVPRGQYQRLNASVSLDGGITAPTGRGTPVGTVNIAYDEELIAEHPLLALEDIEQGGIVRRLTDSLLMWWYN